MLEKLRSRHPIDVPAEEWQTSRGLLTSLGGLLVLFVLVPLGLGAYAVVRLAADPNGSLNPLLAVGLALGALVLVVLIASARGKPAHRRR